MDIEILPDPAIADVLTVEEDVETVADEILVEVKQCQTKLENLTADLARLQSEDREGRESQRAQREQIAELLLEIKNSRVELKSLREQVEASMEQRQALAPSVSQDSPPSIPSALPTTDPASAGDGPPVVAPRKKKYRMI